MSTIKVTLTYELPEDRARRLTGDLTAAGYHAGMPQQRSASSTHEVVISDVDEESCNDVQALVKGLEPLANPVVD